MRVVNGSCVIRPIHDVQFPSEYAARKEAIDLPAVELLIIAALLI
jgi:hypothetical protein